MGRVARYKKSKELKGPSSFDDDRLTNQAPIDNEKEQVPRNVAMLMKGVDKAKATMTRKKNRGRHPNGAADGVGKFVTNETGKGKAKLKGKGKNESKDSKHNQTDVSKISELQQKPKETLKAFGRRVDQFAAEKIYTAAHKHTNSAAKRETWTQAKLEKKKGIKANRIKKLVAEGKIAEDVDVAIKTFPTTAKVGFGDVVLEPPRFKAKPKAKQQLKRAPLLLAGKLAESKAAYAAPIRKAMLEDERTRVIEAYRQLQRDKHNAL